jgi:hypothetical protein
MTSHVQFGGMLAIKVILKNKYNKIVFFYFVKIIFNTSVLKLFENIKNILI